MPNRDLDAEHRAALLEQSINKVLDEREARASGSLFVRGPGGWMIGAKGKTAAMAAVALVVGVLVYYHDHKSDVRDAQSLTEHQRLVEAIREQIYVLTLSENERKRLELQMPDSLRHRLSGARPTP